MSYLIVMARDVILMRPESPFVARGPFSCPLLTRRFSSVVVTFVPFEGLARSSQLPIMTRLAAEEAGNHTRIFRS